MRILLFFCSSIFAIGSYPGYAESVKGYLELHPPFVVEDIAKLARQQQDSFDVPQFHSVIFVEYDTRIEWINGCAWLNAQTEKVMQFYEPPQNGTAESHYFCAISRTYHEATVDALSGVQELANELTQQFGGAITRWTFDFREHSGREDAAYMGLTIAEASPELCAEIGIAYGCDVPAGVVVVAVTGTPARAAGLKKGDILLRLNGQSVSDSTDVVEIIGSASPGEAFYAAILRGHQEAQIVGVFGSLE